MKRYLVVFTFFLIVNSVFAAKIVSVSVYRDDTQTLILEDILDKPFETANPENINYGYTTDAIWLKIILDVTKNKSEDLLYLKKPIQDSISFFYQKSNGWNVNHTGILTQDEKLKRKSGYYFPIDSTSSIIYLRAKGTKSLVLPLDIVSKEKQFSNESRRNQTGGVLIGFFLMLTLYMLFLGGSVQYRETWYFIISSLITTIGTLGITGFWNTNEYISSGILKDYVIISCIGLGTAFWGTFCIQFLQIKRYSILAYGLLLASILITTLATLIPIGANLWGIPTTYATQTYALMFFCLVALYSGIISYKQGNENAKFYVWAWAICLVGILILGLKAVDILPSNEITNNLYWLVSFIQMLFLSGATASKYRGLQKERTKIEKKLENNQYDLHRVVADHSTVVPFKENLISRLDNIKASQVDKRNGMITQLIRELENQLPLEKKQHTLNEKVDEINEEFKDKLRAKYANLTASEIEICGYVLIGLSDHEIAVFRRTSSDAIKTARYRIRKKMSLEKKETIESALKKL